MADPATLLGMRWASAHSESLDAAVAAAEVAGALRADLGEGPIDLVLAFVSAAHLAGTNVIAAELRRELAPGTLAGVSGRGIVTRSREIESGPALAVIAARLPGVQVRPFLILREAWQGAFDEPGVFDMLAPDVRDAECVLLIGDPFSLDVPGVLGAFNRHAPGVRLVGGLASAAQRAHRNALFLNDWMSHEGGFGIALAGALRADVIVSQGCEPIGPPLDVTHVEEHLILTLDGQPAVERAQQVLRAVPEAQRERLGQGLYIGRPVRGDASGRGDYLIRNLLGADQERGAIAVADVLSPREKIRLHVRDARAAATDLEMLLSPQVFDGRAAGVIAFECNGRGRMLFGTPDHDIQSIQRVLGDVPAAGMFCAGEIGPLGAKNHLHGHTASIVILRPR